MKVQATIVLNLRAGSLAEAGALLDDILDAARMRDRVDVADVELHTPVGATPVTLPASERSREPLHVPPTPR
jgi:hypothetical protein